MPNDTFVRHHAVDACMSHAVMRVVASRASATAVQAGARNGVYAVAQTTMRTTVLNRLANNLLDTIGHERSHSPLPFARKTLQ